MLKFKNLFSSKIVLLAVTCLFLFNNTAHGVTFPEKTHLRVQLPNNSEEGKKRLLASMHALKATTGDKYQFDLQEVVKTELLNLEQSPGLIDPNDFLVTSIRISMYKEMRKAGVPEDRAREIAKGVIRSLFDEDCEMMAAANLVERDGEVAIGGKVGGTSFKFSGISKDGEFIFKGTKKEWKKTTGQEAKDLTVGKIADSLANGIVEAINGIQDSEKQGVIKVGISVPGQTENIEGWGRIAGYRSGTPNMPFSDTKLADIIEKKLAGKGYKNVKIYLMNDSFARLVGELSATGTLGHNNWDSGTIVISGTGVNASMAIDGMPFTANGALTELGNVVLAFKEFDPMKSRFINMAYEWKGVFPPDVELSRKGLQRLEVLINGAGLSDLANLFGFTVQDSSSNLPDATKAAEAGDEKALKVIELYGMVAGKGLASIVTEGKGYNQKWADHIVLVSGVFENYAKNVSVPIERIERLASGHTLTQELALLSKKLDAGISPDRLAKIILDSIVPSRLITDVAESGGRPTSTVLAELKKNSLTKFYADNKGSSVPISTAGIKVRGLVVQLDKTIETIAQQQGVSKERMTDIFISAVNPFSFVDNIEKAQYLLARGDIALEIQRVPLFALIGTTYGIKYLMDDVTTGTMITLKVDDLISSGALEGYAPGLLEMEVTFPGKGIEVDEGQWNLVKAHFDAVADASARQNYSYRGNVMGYYKEFLETDAKAIDNFVNKVFKEGKDQVKYIITTGIGANEMFSHGMAALNNAFYTKGIKWIVLNSAKDVTNIPADATAGNTIVIEESRSGETKPTLAFANYTWKRFPNRIVYANKGALKNFAQKISKQGANTLILDFTQNIGGRLMRRKTPMLLALLYLSDIDHEKYMKDTDEYDRKLDFKLKDKSLAVQLARFIFVNTLLGKKRHFSTMNNWSQFLGHFMYELRQLWMEGAQKNEDYELVMNVNAFPRDAHVAMQGVLDQADKSMALSIIARKSGLPEHEVTLSAEDVEDPVYIGLTPNDWEYAETTPNVTEAKASMPTISIEMDQITSAVAPALSSLFEDMVVHFCALTGQDPNSNPKVKPIREETGTLLAKIAANKRERLASGHALKSSRRQQVASRDQIIAVAASWVIADRKGFKQWITNQPENIAVVIISTQKEYPGVYEYRDIAYIKVVGRDISGDYHSTLVDLFYTYGKRDLFGGFKLGDPYTLEKYRELIGQIEKGV